MTAAPSGAAGPRTARRFRAAARLELAEVLRSRWLLFCLAIYGVVASGFVLVGLSESAILGFSGMSRSLLSITHALLVALPLLALMAHGQSINRARDDGSLEILFAQPLGRGTWFLAVALVRFGVLFVPLAAVMLGLALYARASGAEIGTLTFALRALVICAALLFAFGGLGTAISTLVRNPARVVTYLILTWALGVALLDFALVGVLLRWQLPAESVFVLASANPVQAARMALLSAVQPDLSTFGPVGFYLANRIGPTALFALGVGWPLTVGASAFAIAWASFRRGDLV